MGMQPTPPPNFDAHPQPAPVNVPFEVADIVALIEMCQRAPHSLAEERWLQGLRTQIAPLLKQETNRNQ